MLFVSQLLFTKVKGIFKCCSPVSGDVLMDENPNVSSGNTKFCKHCGSKIASDAVLCIHCGRQVESLSTPAAPVVATPIIVNNNNNNNNGVPANSNAKSKWVAVCLCLFLGFLGAHKFYEGKIGSGILYLLSMGLFGIGVLIDLIILLNKPDPYYV